MKHRGISGVGVIPPGKIEIVIDSETMSQMSIYADIGEHMLRVWKLAVPDRRLLTAKLAKIGPMVADIQERSSHDTNFPLILSEREMGVLLDYAYVLGSLGPRSPTVRQRAKDSIAFKARWGKELKRKREGGLSEREQALRAAITKAYLPDRKGIAIIKAVNEDPAIRRLFPQGVKDGVVYGRLRKLFC